MALAFVYVFACRRTMPPNRISGGAFDGPPLVRLGLVVRRPRGIRRMAAGRLG